MVAGKRFAVGDRVRCKTSAAKWKRGRIVQLQYRESHWPEGRVMPYQIELDDGALIYAPADSDSLLQAEGQFDDSLDSAVEIHVCEAGPCRQAGAAAVLLEIEELARGVGAFGVRSSGCLGNCNQGPNALLVTDGAERLFPKLCDLSASAALVERACGRAPSLEDAQMVARLARARRLRVRMQARKESKWNLALVGLAEDVDAATSAELRAELVQEYAVLLAAAGFCSKALDVLSPAVSTDLSLRDIPTLRLLVQRAELLAQLGRVGDIQALQGRVKHLQACSPRDRSIKAEVVKILREHEQSVRPTPMGGPLPAPPADEPARIQEYAIWRLHSIRPLSKHSAVYHFHSDDSSRGTPIRKGRGGRTVWSKTWHTTMLAQVGEERNGEGPLPWVERDYTPISTAREWEKGRCDILIKIYLDPPGLATSWLHRISAANDGAVCSGAASAGADGAGGAGEQGLVWLSRPMKTLHVPSLALEDKDINRKHASVMLLVAGTGIVAVPQVLHHASSATSFDAHPPLKQPVSVIYSCRSDDALLIPELAGWCRNRSLGRCMVLVTETQSRAAAFPDVGDTDVAAAFSGLDNAVCVQARLAPEMLRAELELLQKPLRIVVSGPASFNGAAKSMLEHMGVAAEAITILSA